MASWRGPEEWAERFRREYPGRAPVDLASCLRSYGEQVRERCAAALDALIAGKEAEARMGPPGICGPAIIHALQDRAALIRALDLETGEVRP